MRVRPVLISSIFLIVSTCQTTCIVTSEIEFEDAVNYPLTVVRFSPVESLQTVPETGGAGKTFVLTVWDPDVMNEQDLKARIYIARESDSEDIVESPFIACPEAGHEYASGAGIDDYYINNGTLADVECNLSTHEITLSGSPPGTLISVRMEVSDLGYTGELPAEGAYTVDVTWLFRVVDFN